MTTRPALLVRVLNAALGLELGSFIEASLPRRQRFLEAMRILADGGKLQGNPTWPELFDNLTPERAAALEDLYDALPDGARAEWDSRYGRPSGI